MLAAPPAQAACSGPGGRLHALGTGAWWIEAASGDSNASNRGATANLWAVRQGRALWLVGGAGTPVLARQATCLLREAGAGRVTDVILPWPHAELTLGAKAFEGARLWAHADTAEAMRQRCPRCVERMAQRLGVAASDLGDDPIPRPTQLLRGAQGRVGPFDWWRLQRADETAVLALRWRGHALWSAHGLAWGDGPPDLRDGDALHLARSLDQLQAAMPGTARVLPEQGPWMAPAQLRAQRDEMRRLVDAVDAALRRGDLVTDTPPPAWAGGHPRQSLNWQRTWSQREAVVF
ncbi:hypothetical protein KAK06_08020 [Ideonella sp. 4Y11]|uniref:MBL fold metallo-hydrolase n=1 Tax=Ideonella aquatica TaxID=2824119 RepID=A0A941BJI3_9BURK|nr:hypothetical protein [Ideonella aquatica]MBQ0958903.1 hypothetical protein [Ideonella aquatica]